MPADIALFVPVPSADVFARFQGLEASQTSLFFFAQFVICISIYPAWTARGSCIPGPLVRHGMTVLETRRTGLFRASNPTSWPAPSYRPGPPTTFQSLLQVSRVCFSRGAGNNPPLPNPVASSLRIPRSRVAGSDSFPVRKDRLDSARRYSSLCNSRSLPSRFFSFLDGVSFVSVDVLLDHDQKRVFWEVSSSTRDAGGSKEGQIWHGLPKKSRLTAQCRRKDYYITLQSVTSRWQRTLVRATIRYSYATFAKDRYAFCSKRYKTTTDNFSPLFVSSVPSRYTPAQPIAK